ncbi:membrane dipeptidase, partial [candidate division KSB1 bacterium]|nr:membrane dipeptidase [candidate division KSB1 bacterium]
RMGVRYITLCHVRNNDICDSSNDPAGAEHNGLSEFGKQAVAEMNRLGIMVDVSHISDKSFYDVLEYSQAPVMASHSSARAICDNPRNLDDRMIRALAKNGGVMQICILSDYVKTLPVNPLREAKLDSLRNIYGPWADITDEKVKQKYLEEYNAVNDRYPRPRATVADVVDHIDHVVKLVGIDYVGIGTDFDGGGGVEGCDDVSEMGNITAELLKRGYSQQQIAKIWGGNFLRVFQQVEALASP